MLDADSEKRIAELEEKILTCEQASLVLQDSEKRYRRLFESAKDGILINAILPGALDTPMTRENVAQEQLQKLSSATHFNKLATTEDVANLAYFLCSSQNTGITGQFIATDLGFSHVRLL